MKVIFMIYANILYINLHGKYFCQAGARPRLSIWVWVELAVLHNFLAVLLIARCTDCDWTVSVG